MFSPPSWWWCDSEVQARPRLDIAKLEPNGKYVGRLHRLHDNKRVVQVYDYVDPQVLMLSRMYQRRLRGYADMGYTIVDGPVGQQGLFEGA